MLTAEPISAHKGHQKRTIITYINRVERRKMYFVQGVAQKMADQLVAGSDAVQTGENAFSIDGSQTGELKLPENLSVSEADFAFEGGDLVMTFPDGTTVTVEGYQDNPNPPTLTSADGAEVGSDVVSAIADAGAPAGGEGGFGFMPTEQAEAIQAAEASGNIADSGSVISGTDGEPIGNIESLQGEVFAIRVDGSRVRLELGDEVFQGDILESGEGSNVGVLLADETTFAMGPEGQMVLDEMIYDPATQEGSVSMSVLQGVFTFVSGQVAKTDPDAMTLDTPVATIGIRGTQVGLDIRDGENLNVHLMEERDQFVGEVVIVNDAGVQVLNDANAFSTVSSFDSAPTPFEIVSVDEIVTTYGDATLRFIPTRNSEGERTSANTYEDQSPDAENVDGEDRESLDFLNDFQTDAGGPEEAPGEDIRVTGEYEELNIVEQARGDLADVNKFVEEEVPVVEIEQNDGLFEQEERQEVGVNDEDIVVLPNDLQSLVNSGTLQNVVVSPDGNTVTADVENDFDASDFDYTFVLTGSNERNVITTGSGDDIIGGTGADDILDAGAGDDTLIAAPGGGDDTYIGGDGIDTLTFAATDDDLIINLNTGTVDGQTVGTASGSEELGTDTIIEIENIIGGSGNDTIIGDDNDNVLEGGAGDDFINGAGGQDTAVFNSTYGESTIRVVEGVMTVTGPDGTDTIENVENFAFTDSPNVVVGLEDTAFLLNVSDHLPSADSATSVVIAGIPAGATLSAGQLQEDGTWVVDGGDIEGLTLTGATDSAEDFSVSFTSYGVDYLASATQAVQQYLSENTDEETGEPLQTFEDFLADGGSILELATGAASEFMPAATGTGSAAVEVVGLLDPFTITVGGVDLTSDGTGENITFVGTEDQEIPLDIVGNLSDTDGSEVVSVTISGLPTVEVQEATREIPVLDADGEPVLDDDGNPVTETETFFEPVTDENGDPVGAHLVYTDANGNDVVLPANDTGTYELTGQQLNNLRMVGSPDDSSNFDLEISAQVQDGESTATVFGNATVQMHAAADVPTVNGSADQGIEDQPININFDIDKNDISEHITDITLTGIPQGSRLSIEYTDPNTGETFPVQIPVINGEASIPLGFLGEDMATDGLVLTPPAHLSGDFNLQLEVTSTEPTNGDTATNLFAMPLNITAVADELGVTINDATVVDGDVVTINTDEDGTFALDISAMTEDTDGSEVLSVTIAGVPTGALLSAGTDNGDGTWTLTPEEYEGLSITPPADSDVNFDLTVTVTNVDNNEDTTSLEATVSIDVAAVADDANLTANDALGLEDTPIALDIASSLNDTDGSETLSITIEGVPTGAQLSGGVDNGDGSWTLSPEDLDGLTITPGAHVSGEFSLTVTATTTEAENGDTASVSQQIGLSITPDPDAPIVNVAPISGNEDTAIPLNIDASLVDQDGSETLSVSITGVPEGAVLSSGTNLGNGIWDIDPADLANLTITPPADSNLDFTLGVTATATESNGEIAETSAEIPVSVFGVADDPTLNADEVVGLEGNPIDLNISATLNDTDGSESLSITIENIPDGAFLLSGGNVVAIQDGVATLTGDELADLSILPPMGSDEDFDLLVTATSTEDDADVTGNGQGVASVSGTLSVVVQEEADPPALMLFDASGNEDLPIPLNIAAILTDPDETLSVEVSGIPEGTVLSAGTLNDDGTWSLEAGDLQGLTITMPENASGEFSVQVTATSTTDDGTFATQSGSLNVSVAGVADDANLNLTDLQADEGMEIPLNIDASLVDADGSETLSVTVSNLPEGSILTNALGDTLNIVDGSVTLTSEQLEGLTMTTPQGLDTDFTLQVTATTTEADADLTGNDQGTSSVSGVINVDMTAIAEVPTLVLQDASGLEDGPIPLSIDAMVQDTSETLSITIAGVPEGAMLSAGSNNNDGTWTLTPAQLEGLTITPPADSNEDFQLEVTATSTEQDGTSASNVGSISVGVTGVADAADLSVGDVSGVEDGAVALNISANLSDTDGSETLSITIEGVPEGATLSTGSKNADGSWTLTGEQLDGLTLTPAADTSGSFSLMVTATSTENDGDSSTVTGLMNVDIGSVADAPTLVLHDAAGFEDDAIPMEISTASQGGDAITGITISGVPSGAVLSAGTDNGDGTWTLTEGDLDGLTITPPADSNTNFQLNISVESTDGTDTATTTQAMNVAVTAVADKPTLDVPSQISVEGVDAVDLSIDAALTDLDGSESLSINISNIPDGAVLSIGDSILPVVGGTIDLDPSQLGGLQITPPVGFDGNFTLQVTATSSDTDPDSDIPDGLETNVSIGFIDVEVDGIIINDPDAPNLDVDNAVGLEDNAIPLDIEASLTDLSETLSLTISGVPAGASLSNGTDLGNGTWTLLPEELDGLTITPPNDSNVDFNLTVTATSTTEDGSFATTTGVVGVDVIGVADQPDLSVSVGEGQVIDLLTGEPPIIGDLPDGVTQEIASVFPLDISSNLNDVDGSETLSLTISGLPAGVTLSAGEQIDDTTWLLTPEDIDGLTMTVPEGIDPDFDFDVSATATEDDGDTATVTETVGVEGDVTAEDPTLDVSDAAGDEDTAIALDIDAALTDTDGSETLSVTISGVPNGASLSAGTDNNDGTWTLTPEQLEGLTVTPPADSDVDFTLTVDATSVEQSSGDTAVTSATIAVAVNAVADTPSVAADDGDGIVGQTIPFDIESLLSDTDGSESLSITISGFPEGASLTAGTDNEDGSFTLTPAQLNGLAIELPEGASDDFDLTVTATSTEAENNDQASNVVTASINVDPTANDDRNVVEIGEVTTGNVLTGEGDSEDPAAAADTGSAADNAIVDVSFGGTTKSFANPDDVMSDEAGDYVLIDGDHGTLKMYADGTYDYSADEGETESQVAGLTGSASASAVEEAWSGVQTFAFEFGTSYVDGNGQFDPSLADGQISFSGDGVGVAGTQNGMPVPNQINHDEVTGESEALGINLGAETTSATVTVSRMFRSEDGGEEGAWQAFDADGNLVGEGVLNSETVDYGGSSNVGSAEISLPDGASFQYIVFTATDTANDTNPNDSSDFFIRSVEFETTTGGEPGEDVFTYTMQDADGDTASATLSIDVNEELDNVASDPTLDIDNVAGDEDTPIPLEIASSLTDTDGSEVLSITIAGVPSGAELSAGQNNGDGIWTLVEGDLQGLTITPPENSNEDFSLSVTATSTEENGGATSEVTATMNVDVTGVADTPTVTASATIIERETDSGKGNEGHGNGDDAPPPGHEDNQNDVSSAYGDASLELDPIAYFNMSGTSKAKDVAGNHNADLNGVTLGGDDTGLDDVAAVFDGNGDYMEVAHKSDMEMAEGTFVLWFNTDDAESKQGLFSKDSMGYDDGGHLSSWVDDGQLRVRLQSGDQSFFVQGGDVTSGAWNQMAFSFGPDGMQLYLNGDLVDSDSYDGGLLGNEEPLVFGASSAVSGDEKANNLRDFFEGQMDEIGIYDRALTPTELVNLYDTGVQQIADNNEGNALVYDIDIQGTLVDVDGSETLSFEVRGLPEGVELSAGENDGNGIWSLGPDELEGLTMTVGGNVTEDFSIEVVAISEENDGDVAESSVVNLDIAVEEPTEINGTSSSETLEGGDGRDVIDGEGGNDKLYGFEGDDVLNGGSGNDSLFGDSGDDVLNGDSGNDYLRGGEGNDEMSGGSGRDEMYGDAGNDVMMGDGGDDLMLGGAGNDRMDGGADDDTLSGGDGADTLEGGLGDDKLYGGDGDDILRGGQGNDLLSGGQGADQFVMDAEGGHDIIQDIMEQDTIVFEGQEFHAEDMIFNENDDGDVVVSFAGVEGQSVTLNGVSMDDLDHNNDGDVSDGYSITENDGKVTLTIDSQ